MRGFRMQIDDINDPSQLAAGLKGQGFTQCFVCGSQLSLRGDEWRLRSKYEDGPQAGGSKYGKVDNGVIDVHIDDAEWEARRAKWTKPPYKKDRGTLYKYIKNVKTASEGCVTDE